MTMASAMLRKSARTRSSAAPQKKRDDECKRIFTLTSIIVISARTCILYIILNSTKHLF